MLHLYIGGSPTSWNHNIDTISLHNICVVHVLSHQGSCICSHVTNGSTIFTLLHLCLLRGKYLALQWLNTLHCSPAGHSLCFHLVLDRKCVAVLSELYFSENNCPETWMRCWWDWWEWTKTLMRCLLTFSDSWPTWKSQKCRRSISYPIIITVYNLQSHLSQW